MLIVIFKNGDFFIRGDFCRKKWFQIYELELNLILSEFQPINQVKLDMKIPSQLTFWKVRTKLEHLSFKLLTLYFSNFQQSCWSKNTKKVFLLWQEARSLFHHPPLSIAQKSIMKCFTTVEELGIVYENYQKSLILQHCERSELSLFHNFTLTVNT